MSYTTNVAVTALNIMDGIALHEKWDELQAVWEQEGGFLEFCIWITEIAEESERQLAEREPQNFPGIYDYEVSCELGTQIEMFMLHEKRIPEPAEWKHWLEVLADAFFAEGELE